MICQILEVGISGVLLTERVERLEISVTAARPGQGMIAQQQSVPSFD